MSGRETRKWAAVVASAVLAVVAMSMSDLSARPGCCGGKGMPAYDPGSEVTVSGSVEEIVTMDCGCKGRIGTHVRLKSDGGTREVALGPADFLADRKVEIARGDALEVTGAESRCGGSDVLLARVLRIGDRSFTLRDADGAPAWRGRR